MVRLAHQSAEDGRGREAEIGSEGKSHLVIDVQRLGRLERIAPADADNRLQPCPRWIERKELRGPRGNVLTRRDRQLRLEAQLDVWLAGSDLKRAAHSLAPCLQGGVSALRELPSLDRRHQGVVPRNANLLLGKEGEQLVGGL